MKKGVMRMAAAFMLLFVLVVSCSAQSAAETEPAAAGQAAGDTAAAGSAAIAGSAAVSGKSNLPEPTDLVTRFSYALGYLQTQSYVSQGIEFDVDYYAAAMAAAISGSTVCSGSRLVALSDLFMLRFSTPYSIIFFSFPTLLQELFFQCGDCACHLRMSFSGRYPR